MFIYHFLDYFFFIFHTLLTVFNMVGWAFPKTRKLHLFTLTATAFSWFVLGIWHGWGYCVSTDWHWRVREQLGYHDKSNSYIHFLILKLTGINLPEGLVEIATLVGFLISMALSIILNVRDYKRKKEKKQQA